MQSDAECTARYGTVHWEVTQGLMQELLCFCQSLQCDRSESYPP